MAQASEEAAAAAGIRIHRAHRVFSARRWDGRGAVAGASTTDVVGGARSHLLLARALAVEFIIKGEWGLLGSEVDVPRAASAAAELAGSLGQAVLEVGGRARGGAWVRGLGSLEGVAGTAPAGVDVVAGGGVGFGDGIAGH